MQVETKIFRSDDSKQKGRIHEGLRLISPAAAAFYQDACRIMEMEEPFESATHLVGHLIREIESSLRWALEPYKLDSQQKKVETRDARALLEKAGVSKSDPLPKAWLEFMKTLGASHKEDIKALLRGLEIPESDPTAVGWLKLAGEFHDWAHRDNLEPPRPMDQKFRKFWDQTTEIFSVVLEKLVSQYLNSFNFLDELLNLKAPTKKDAKKLRLNVPNNSATYGYFFHRLNNPAWLPLLRSQKVFDRPMEPIYERRGDGYLVSYPSWPQSRYLARMAASSDVAVRELVVKIALSIQTDNISIHQDLLDVANALPATWAAAVAKHESAWIAKKTRLDGLLPEKIGGLLAHLSEGSQVKPAIALARATLAVLPNPRAHEENDKLWSWHREPVSRLGGWYYGRVLQLSLPALVRAGGLEAVEMFCDLLETAINLYQEHSPLEDTDDHSDTWRTDVEYRNHDDVKDYLVSAVVKSVEQIARTEQGQMPVLVTTLEARPWRVFKRITLYLLRVAPDNADTLIAERLTNPNNQNAPLSNEYIALLREHLSRLSAGQQDEILTRLSSGPTVVAVREQHEWFTGSTLTDEEAEKAVKRVKISRLTPLREGLPDEWKRRFDQWVQDTAEPPKTDEERSMPHQTESIKTLESKSVSDIINLLANQTQTSSNQHSHSTNLAAELRALVETEPQRLGNRAGDFKILEPIYVHAFLSGALNAVQQGRSIPWKQVFTLCRWVLKQPSDHQPSEDEGLEQETLLLRTKSVIARLLTAGFKEGNIEIPLKLRTSAWRLLEPFTDDPQPTPADDERWGSDSDLFGHALNTVRGNALDTVLHYALWVQRHLKNEPNGDQRVANGFDEMPEVRNILEHHLNPENDPSLAIRSIYGRWLPNFVMLDEKWLQLNLSRIFPTNENEREMLLVAWGTYLRAWDVYNNIFNALIEEYRRAIDRIREENPGHKSQLDQRLAEHVIRTYGFGNLILDEPEGLLDRFYAKAPDSLCAHVLWHVGYTFHEMKEAVPQPVLQRFQTLWEKRLNVARVDPQARIKEMIAFGNLFYSEKFDDGWAIRELKNALEISKWAEPALFVVQRLATLARGYPGIAVQCLAYMVEGIKEEGALISWGLPIRTIISAARQSDAESIQIAIKLVHRLGARGHTEFRDLL